MTDELLEAAIREFNEALPAFLPWESEPLNTQSQASSHGRYSGSTYSAPSSQSYRAGSSGGYSMGAAVKPRVPRPTQSQTSSGFSSARSVMSSQTATPTAYTSTATPKAPLPTLTSFQSASSSNLQQLRDIGKATITPSAQGQTKRSSDSGQGGLSKKAKGL